MAQDGTTAGGSSYTIDNVTFPVGRSKLQSIFDAIRTTNIGNTAPDLVAGQFWIDNNTPSTTVWTLYFYDGTDNISFATIDTVNNTVNFIDSTFTQLTSDLASNGNNINFGDNDKANFGDSNDLQIYHTGTNSIIDDLGTGNLLIRSDGSAISLQVNSKNNIRAVSDAEVELYYNNNLKFETTSTGATVTGNLTATGNLTSLGIDDNATSTAITIDSSQNVGIGAIPSSGAKLDIYNGGINVDTTGSALLATRYNSGNGSTNINLYKSQSATIGTHTALSNGSGIGGIITRGSDGTSFINATAIFSEVDGTVSTNSVPSRITFSTNSGSTAYSERMRITSTGSMGVGTSSPSQLLHVYSTINQIGRFETSVTEGQLSLKDLTGEAILKFRNDYRFTNSTGELVRIDSSGKVGINTSSPTNPLMVQGSQGYASSASTLLTSTTKAAARIRGSNDASTSLWMGVETSNANPYLQVSNGTGTSSDPLLLQPFGGNVGINTTSPQEKLHIETPTGSASETGLRIRNGTSATDVMAQIKLQGGYASTSNEATAIISGGRDGTGNGSKITFSTGTTSQSERMRITSAGLMGVGTSSPSAKLQVTTAISGVTPNANADELFIENNGAAGITIGSGANEKGNIFFADSGNALDGYIQYAHDTRYLRFATAGSERMRILANGKIGVGTSSPDADLEVFLSGTSGTTTISAGNGINQSGNYHDFAVASNNSDYAVGIRRHLTQSNPAYLEPRMDFFVQNTNTYLPADRGVKMTLLNNGRLGINTTSPSKTLDVAGDALITKNDTPLYLNRIGSDGEIARFSKDGISNGQIATLSSKMYIGTGNANFRFRDDLTAIIPANSDGSNSDNDLDLGYSTVRWRRLYLSEGIRLGGTGSANNLDDYEEGTWTPVFSSGTGGFGGTGLSVVTSAYRKIGNQVHLYASITITSGSSLSVGDSLLFTGQPFTPISPYTYRMGVATTNTAVASNNVAVGVIASTSTNPGSMRLVITQVNGSASTTAQTHFNIHYPTS